MAADDDVLHLENADSILDHGKAVEIGVDHHVGHVSMHEHLPGEQPDQFIGRETAPAIHCCQGAGPH